MAGARAKRGYIPDGLYKKILTLVPIPCVEVMIVSGKRFLLCERKEEPAKGTWWFIGGRVFKGETLKQAVVRKTREEAGVRSMRIKKFLWTKETMFARSAQGVPTHTINSLFLVEVRSSAKVRPDGTSAELKWFSRIDPRWPQYVKEALKVAGFN